MSTLSPEARALLDAAREGLAPDAAALRRVRAKIDAAVAGTSATATSATAAIAKLAIVLGIATVIAAFIATRDTNHVSPPALALTSSPTHDPPVQRAHDDPPPSTAYIEMQPAAPATRPPTTSPPRVEATVEPTIDLAREVELVDAAMAALKKQDPTAALAHVRLHRAETHGRGQLAEDAAAIEIEALCRLHDRRTAAKLDAFDARWPQSAQRSRLTSTCP